MLNQDKNILIGLLLQFEQAILAAYARDPEAQAEDAAILSIIDRNIKSVKKQVHNL
jgi:hypothetical protein